MQNILIVSIIVLASALVYQGIKYRELEKMTLDVLKMICHRILKIQVREET